MTIGEEGVCLRDLGDGLILRRAITADTEALAAFNADVHRMPGTVRPDEEVAAWTRDLMSGGHRRVLRTTSRSSKTPAEESSSRLSV
jgi:hypothetical protein